MVEEADGVRLRFVRFTSHAEVAKLAGMLKAPVRGVPRRLEDFDGAAVAAGDRADTPRSERAR
jgi:antitoxin PrlF